MATRQTANNVQTSFSLPSIFNIQYPNCRTGMFCLRQPFKNLQTKHFQPTNIDEEPLTNQEEPFELIPIPTVQQTRQKNSIQLSPIRSRQLTTRPKKSAEIVPIQSKRNAQVQCSLLSPIVRQNMAVQTEFDRQQSMENDKEIDHQYYRETNLQPFEQRYKFVEIWNDESEQYQEMPTDQTITRSKLGNSYERNRKPIIDYDDDLDDEESDYDEERILYARQHRKTMKKTYLPPNVQMICIRDDGNKVSY